MRIKTDKPTVTIGIPAYNEAANIKNLLQSIFNQQQQNYVLEKIIVVSDGSSDQTNQIVKKLQNIWPLIELYEDGLRLGKTKRINQIFLLNRSQFIINLDADVTLADKQSLDHLMTGVSDQRVIMAAGNYLPRISGGWVNRITTTADKLWYLARKDYKNGDNIFNSSGSIRVIRGNVVEKLMIPKQIVADQQYLFLKSKEYGGFRFIKEAVVWYQSPTKLKDFLGQARRALTEGRQLTNIFGDKIRQEYKLPWQLMLKAIFQQLLNDPLFTSLALGLLVMVRISPRVDTSWELTGVWQTAESTKKAIEVNYERVN